MKNLKFGNSELENIDLAYSELILRQQQKLAELKTKIRQKIEAFYDLVEKRRTNYFESVSKITIGKYLLFRLENEKN